MNPVIAGALGGAVVIGYLPSLRRQIRDGAVQIGHLGVRPILIRRSAHPLAFRLGSAALVVIVLLLLAACLAAIVKGIAA